MRDRVSVTLDDGPNASETSELSEQHAFLDVCESREEEIDGRETVECVSASSIEPPEEGVETTPLSLEEQAEVLREAMMRNPRLREIEYRILGLCRVQQNLRDLEEEIGRMPEFKHCGQNQYRILVYLEIAGGLDRFSIDADGSVVTDEMTEGLTADEIDDLVVDYAFRTTEAGRVVYDEMSPERRLEDLLQHIPGRSATYCEVLEFCQEPRAFKEIDALLRDRDILRAGSLNPMTKIPLQPSVFVDNLERNGGIVWDGAWKITEGGRKYLEMLKTIAS